MIENKDLEIEKFLEGHNDKKYVVAIETDYYDNHAQLVIHDPTLGKHIEKVKYNPFIFMKEFPKDIKEKFYKNDSAYIAKMKTEHGITIKRLNTKDKYNKEVDRLTNGYKYLVSTSKSFNELIKFFRSGGIDIFHEKYKNLFVRSSLDEQFMIQTGIRLFKGYDLYTDVHKLVFDIETTGLDSSFERVIMIGMSDNKGFQKVLTIDKENDDESEIKIIKDFFETLDEVKPAIICGYNSENFDFTFILKRLEILGVDIKSIKTTLNDNKEIKKKESMLKLGGEVEKYQKTIMWGYGIIDTYFAVRRAKAINSEIKEAGLKYITKFAKAAKKDRMYITQNIGKLWSDNKIHIINKENNEYNIIPEELQKEAIGKFEYEKTFNDPIIYSKELQEYLLKKREEGKTDFIYGSEIVNQYLMDDLWETTEVDRIFNESSFMVSKWLPSGFSRCCTIGGASSWNLIMIAWSYENNLAIPHATQKREFVGGLSRTFRLGYSKNIVKADYAGLYPSIQLEHNVFPKHDVTNVLYRLLKYFKDNRDIYKKLAKTSEDPKLKRFYDTKQLPLKIFNNSNFGANGSEYFFWSDMDIAERITCSGRQYLRLMVKFFENYGFKIIVLDTDGVNTVPPKFVTKDWNGNDLTTSIAFDDVTYIDKNNKVFRGLDAFFEKFNEDILASKFMKVDNDGMWVAGINLARKNYVSYEVEEIQIESKVAGFVDDTTDEGHLNFEEAMVFEEKTTVETKEKLKLVGNSIKSTNIPKYIEDFLGNGLKMIIKDLPKSFVELYYDLLTKIYYKQLSASQIASKAKVKKSVDTYCKEIYLPFIIKTVFDFKVLKEGVKELEEEVVSISEDTKDGKPKKVKEKQTIGELIKYIENVKKKNKIKVATINVPTKSIQDKIEYIIKNGYHTDKNLPQILRGDNFVEIFSNDFVSGVDKFIQEYVINNFTEFREQLVKYFMTYGNVHGQPKARQSHMDLIIEQEKIVNLGDMIYYVNNGTKKTHGDSALNKEGKMYANIIDQEDLSNIVDYNIEKYVTDFNKKIEPLLICFKQNVKETLLVEDPEKRQYYTDEDLELISWDYNSYPYKKEDIDDLYIDSKNVALFKMEDREVRFWNRVGIDPYTIFTKFILPENETLNDFPYYNKYKEIKEKLKKHNIELKDINSRYNEGDVVLITQQDKYYLSIYEKDKFTIEREV